MPERERLLTTVEVDPKSGCWNWTGPIKKHGYGVIKRGKQQMAVHRVAYENFIGPIPEKMHILHSCDNRRCINPEHLRAGTPKDNAEDASTRKRWRPRKGEDAPNSKLNNEEIEAIRRDPRPLQEIANHYRVVKSAISNIKNGHRWKHLPGAKRPQVRAKLNEAQILEIRQKKESNRTAAKRYGVSAATIQAVREGRTWKRVKP